MTTDENKILTDTLVSKIILKTQFDHIKWDTQNGSEFIGQIEVDNEDKTKRIYFYFNIDEKTILRIRMNTNCYSEDKKNFCGSTSKAKYLCLPSSDKTKELYELLQRLNGEKVINSLLATLDLM